MTTSGQVSLQSRVPLTARPHDSHGVSRSTAGIWLAGGIAWLGAQDPGVRLTLLSSGPRVAIVVELGEEPFQAIALEATESHSVAIEIGPVHWAVANQLLKAPQRSPLVDQVRVRGVTRGAGGTIIEIRVRAKRVVSGSVRRAQRRIYIDLEPRDTPGAGVAASTRLVAPDAPNRTPTTGATATAWTKVAATPPRASPPKPSSEAPAPVLSTSAPAVGTRAKTLPPSTLTRGPGPTAVPAAPPPEVFDATLAPLMADLERMKDALLQWQPGYVVVSTFPPQVESLNARLRMLQPPAPLAGPWTSLLSALTELSSTWIPGPDGTLVAFRDDTRAVEKAKTALRTFIDAAEALRLTTPR